VTTPALELQDVRAGYGRIEILRGVSLEVPAGSVVALLGPNGVGKTTTLRAVSGTLPVTGGAIRLDGRRIDNRRPSAIASRGMVLVPEGRGVFPALSVRDNLRVAHHSAPLSVAGPWEGAGGGGGGGAAGGGGAPHRGAPPPPPAAVRRRSLGGLARRDHDHVPNPR
jgi:branched-chain amino acid transport system ATP-binding protein